MKDSFGFTKCLEDGFAEVLALHDGAAPRDAESTGELVEAAGGFCWKNSDE